MKPLNKNYITLFLILLFACSVLQAGSFDKGGILGYGSRAMGMGGAYCSLAEDSTAVYWNPAGLMTLTGPDIRFMYSPQLGFKQHVFSLSAGIPYNDNLAFGILSDNLLHPADKDAGLEVAVEDTVYLSGASVLYSDQFFAGMNLKLRFGSLGTRSLAPPKLDRLAGYGMDVGLLFIQPMKREGSDLRFGLTWDDIHSYYKTIGGTRDPIPSVIKFGTSFRFDPTILIAFGLDYLFDEDLDDASPVMGRFGVEKWFMDGQIGTRIGYLGLLTIRPVFTFGFSWKYKGFGSEYAFVDHTGGLGATHRLTVSQSFFSEKPVKSPVDLILDNTVFSSFSDSNQVLRMSVKFGSVKAVKEWTVHFTDISGAEVALLGGSSAQEEIQWDGRDQEGQILVSGKYTAAYSCRNDSGEVFTAKEKSFLIDLEPPKGNLEADPVKFSPDADGVDDLTKLKFSVQEEGSGLASWKIRIINTEDRLVYLFEGGSEIPKALSWEGLNQSGERVAEGLYRAILDLSDKAGNKYSSSALILTIKNEKPFVDVIAGTNIFSPSLNEIRFNITEMNIRGLQEWELLIGDARLKNIQKRFEGKKELPDIVSWNGRNTEIEYPSDGDYFYRLKVIARGDEEFLSELRSLRIDSLPPQLEVEVDEEFFSPDEDGYLDWVNFKILIKDDTVLNSWVLTVRDSRGMVVRDFSGGGVPPRNIEWNGHDKNDKIIPQGSRYTYRLYARDNAGNESEIGPFPLDTDYYLVPFEEGYKITMEGLEFSTGSSDLSERSLAILARAAKALNGKQVRQFKVRVEGHTDNSGDAQANIVLSQERARAVAAVLSSKGVGKDRLSSQGYGPERPVASNVNEDGRKKNRRVEIILY